VSLREACSRLRWGTGGGGGGGERVGRRKVLIVFKGLCREVVSDEVVCDLPVLILLSK